MLWALVFLLPFWINSIQEFLKLGLGFTLLHHGQVVIEPSQAGPEIFVTHATCQILIKVPKEQKIFNQVHQESDQTTPRDKKNSYLELHSELHAKQSAMKLYSPKGCFKLLSCLFTETSDVSERKKN